MKHHEIILKKKGDLLTTVGLSDHKHGRTLGRSS